MLRIFSLLLPAALAAGAATYEVGPDRPYSSIGQAPWAALQPGDVVLIHWRPEPYREKWVICRQGTADAPITVRGVPSGKGELPVIDGENALTPAPLNFWGETRGVLKIGGANVPADTLPAHIVVENLEIRGARRPHTFTDRFGAKQTYAANAAAIYVEKGVHLTIRNCVLRDSGNGLFIGSVAGTPTRAVLVEGNHIHGNGNVGSLYEHNSYTEALDIVFQYNRYGPLLEGALGNNLKDRSAGLVVRYNWIESGNRQLDLVDAGAELIRDNALYRQTFVYGNILIEPAGAGNRQILHYGGDSGNTGRYRKGTLHFYHNTVVSTRTDRTTLMRLSSNEEHAEARNNIVYATAGGASVSLLDVTGRLDWHPNWIQPGWRVSFSQFEGSVSNHGETVEADAPGFIDAKSQNFHLSEESTALGKSAPLAEAVLPAHQILRQYVRHVASSPRTEESRADMGALGPPEPEPAPDPPSEDEKEAERLGPRP